MNRGTLKLFWQAHL